MTDHGTGPQVLTIEQALAQAHAHWEAGQAGQAVHLCQLILAQFPSQADTLHLLGVIAHASGDLDLAVANLRLACEPAVIPAVYASNLAEICRQRGLLPEAEAAGRRAVGIEPGFVAAWNNLGIILQEAGKLDESLVCLERAVALQPDDPLARNNIGNTLKRLGRLADARVQYEAALALQPDYAEALNNLGTLLGDLGEVDRGLEVIAAAIEANPRLPDAYVNAAGIELGRGAGAEALRWTEALLSFAPAHGDGLRAKAGVLVHLERFEDALPVAREAVSATGGSSEALNVLGETLKGLGRPDEALVAFAEAAGAGGFAQEKALVNGVVTLMETGAVAQARQALDRALADYPRSAAAWMARSDVHRFVPGDPGIAAMEALLAPGGVEAHADRTVLHFALGKAWLDAGDPPRAFAHLEAGNLARRRGLVHDADATDRWLESAPTHFSRDWLERLAGAGNPSQTPVFVVGMPRSGTSLVEQILASHPMVHGAGELSLLGDLVAAQGPFPSVADGLTPDLAAQLGKAYVDRVTSLAPDKIRVVDKMPANFIMAGLISVILPQARIIHVTRDPVDTGLSIYTKLFAKPHPYAYDLVEIGRFHRAYQGLMAYWREALPADRFMEVAYEDVVSDLEGEARRLIAFIGLEWDEACLAFYKTRRTVRTASVNQVRQPLYASSVGRWKPYAAHLGPLLDALGAAPR